MAKVVIQSFQEFEQYVGKEIGISDWHTITQEQIQKFADATLDHQWIHIDQERAEQESPFGKPIAHGYLTISMLTHLWLQIVEFKNVKMMVNYGIEKLRFNKPVEVDKRVRLQTYLESLSNLRGIAKAQMRVVLEIEGEKKPAFEGQIVFLYHFH